MSAIRIGPRGHRARPQLLKFAGNYHGHSDGLLVSGGTAHGLARPPRLGRASPRDAVADTVVAPYNVVPRLDETFAAVIVEPVRRQHGAGAAGARASSRACGPSATGSARC